MAAYMVFIREQITDKDELSIYSGLLPATFDGHPVKILANLGDKIVLEGSAVDGVVIVEFPSRQDALQWYHSPAYQKVVIHRFKGANTSAFIVDGI